MKIDKYGVGSLGFRVGYFRIYCRISGKVRIGCGLFWGCFVFGGECGGGEVYIGFFRSRVLG